MDRNSFFTWLRLTVILLLVTYLLGCPSDREANQSKADALDFSLKTIEGKLVRLKDYRGKKIVHLTFWATWCPGCITEIPKLKKLHQAIGDKPYEILAVDVGVNDSLTRVRKIQQRYQLPYKILFDERGEVATRYGVIGIPVHIIIDKEGNITRRFNQLPEDLKEHLKQFFPS